MENKKSINNIEYILAGDYYIPDLKLPNEERPIGKYGQMHREHLKEHNPTNFISSCPLYLQNRKLIRFTAAPLPTKSSILREP